MVKDTRTHYNNSLRIRKYQEGSTDDGIQYDYSINLPTVEVSAGLTDEQVKNVRINQINKWATENPTKIFGNDFIQQRQYLTDDTWRNVLKQLPEATIDKNKRYIPDNVYSSSYIQSINESLNEAGKVIGNMLLSTIPMSNLGLVGKGASKALNFAWNPAKTILNKTGLASNSIAKVASSITDFGAVHAPTYIDAGKNLYDKLAGNKNWFTNKDGNFDLMTTTETAFDPLILFGNVKSGLRIANNIANRNKFFYHYFEPVGYEIQKDNLGKIIHEMLFGKTPDVNKAPEYYEKMIQNDNLANYLIDELELLENPNINTEKLREIAAKFRLEAYRKYLGLPEKEPLYILNDDGKTFRYNIEYLRKMYNETGARPTVLQNIDWATGNAGGTGPLKMTTHKVESGPDKDKFFISFHMSDKWDLHPFKNRFNFNSKLLSQIINKIKNFEVGKLMGGKPFYLEADIPLIQTVNRSDINNYRITTEFNPSMSQISRPLLIK